MWGLAESNGLREAAPDRDGRAPIARGWNGPSLGQDKRGRARPATSATAEAPGHCEDQVAFHVPGEGWLFSGDAFLHEQRPTRRSSGAAPATPERVARLRRWPGRDRYDA
jgi:hypothetical protein